jgi:hypothetical protein
MNIGTRQFDRRQLLRVVSVAGAGVAGAAVAGAGAIATLSPTPALAESEPARSIVGSWLWDVTQTSGTGTAHQVLILYGPGGVVTGASSSDTAGLIGSWAPAGENQSRATFLLFVFAGGQSIGTVQVRTEETLSPDGNHITGRAVLEFTPFGGAPEPAGTTTFTGTRIKVVPL